MDSVKYSANYSRYPSENVNYKAAELTVNAQS